MRLLRAVSATLLLGASATLVALLEAQAQVESGQTFPGKVIALTDLDTSHLGRRLDEEVS